MPRHAPHHPTTARNHCVTLRRPLAHTNSAAGLRADNDNWRQWSVRWYVIQGDEAPRLLSSGTIGNSQIVSAGNSHDLREGDRVFAVLFHRTDSTASDGPHRVQSETTTVTGFRNPTRWERIERWLTYHEMTVAAILLSGLAVLAIPLIVVFLPVALVLYPFFWFFNWLFGLFR